MGHPRVHRTVSGRQLRLSETSPRQILCPVRSRYQLINSGRVSWEGVDQTKDEADSLALRHSRSSFDPYARCRYLRAERWNTETAITRIEATLNWRREVGISDDDQAQGGLALDGVGLEVEGKDGDE